MTVESLSAILAALIATIGFYLSYTQETVKKRKAAMIFGFLTTAVAALLGAESYTRGIETGKIKAGLEREWANLKETHIKSIQLEIMSADGILTPDLFEISHNIDIDLPSIQYAEDAVAHDQGRFTLGDLITKQSVLENGRIGIPMGTFTTEKTEADQAIETWKSLDCMSSQVATQINLKKANTENWASVACSILVDLKIKDGELMLRDIGMQSHVNVSYEYPNRILCSGPCKKDLIISIRLLMDFFVGVDQTMIEISPYVLKLHAYRADENPDSAIFKLSGDSLMELAKSYYFESYGYRQAEHFPITTGIAYRIYSKLTESEFTAKVIDKVWYTSRRFPKKRWAESAGRQDGIEVLRSGDWCGFGDLDVCWYRYVVFEESSESK